VNTYGTRTERRPHLGTGTAPDAGDILAAAALCRDVTYALIVVLFGLGWAA
jgi:cobalamin biosynthesis protein CobD/CbiB